MISVTIELPDERLAKLSLAWLADGGDQGFYDLAADEAGVYLNFLYGERDVRIHEAGLVVDDDDPELFGVDGELPS